MGVFMTFEEFGESLRACREAKGLSAAEIAEKLRLPLRIVEAIEGGRLEKLPHAAYAKGFTRAYGKAVSFPEKELESALAIIFSLEVPEENATPDESATMVPVKKGGDRLVALLLILLLFVLPVGIGWFVIIKYGNTIMETILRPLSAVSDSTPKPAQPEAPPQPALGTPVDSVTPPPPPAVPVEEPAAAQEQPPVPQQATAPAAPVNPPPAVTAITGKHVILNAKAECWVRAVVDGQRQNRFTLQEGESRLVEYTQNLTITLGNAGDVELTHNGKAYPINARRNERRIIVFE